MANQVITKIRAIARKRREPANVQKAAFETGRVESNFTNPAGGDADSAGWRQERASFYKDPRNLDASINRFFDEADKINHGQKSYQIAADVQRPAAQYRPRYKGASKEAQGLLKGTGSADRGTPTGSSSSTTTTTSTGTDAAALRRQALQAYVLNRDTDPNALLNLASGLRSATTGATTTTTTKTSARAGLASRKRSGSGASGSKVLELIHNDGSGPGYGIKDGQTVNGAQVFSDVWTGHRDHVHVAAGRKTVVALGKLAQSMGLHVGENPHFGGVTQGAHAADSYHYKDEAIDASGTPQQMDKFAKAVAQYNHTKVLPK